MIDLFQGRSAAKLRRWTSQRSKGWQQGVRVVALDLTDTYRAGLFPHLAHATRVADPFHVTRVANRTTRSADGCRTRPSDRGRKGDPLYRNRKLLILGEERLDDRGRDRLMEALRVGDPPPRRNPGHLAGQLSRAGRLFGA